MSAPTPRRSARIAAKMAASQEAPSPLFMTCSFTTDPPTTTVSSEKPQTQTQPQPQPQTQPPLPPLPPLPPSWMATTEEDRKRSKEYLFAAFALYNKVLYDKVGSSADQNNIVALILSHVAEQPILLATHTGFRKDTIQKYEEIKERLWVLDDMALIAKFHPILERFSRMLELLPRHPLYKP